MAYCILPSGIFKGNILTTYYLESTFKSGERNAHIY